MKNLLLFTLFLFCLHSNAQFTIYEDDFNDGEAADWTFIDVDANNSTWLTRKNLKLDPNTGAFTEGTVNILGTYNIDFESGSYYPENENNWAIMPVQDLSFYAGAIELTINAQISEYGGVNQNFLVYVSNSAEIASFLENEPVTIGLTRINDEGEEFQEHVIDLSAYAGQDQVYIAIFKGAPQFLGVEIDDLKITATEVAGVDGVNKSFTRFKHNPVAETLELQLGTNINSAALNVSIYNINGILVKEVKYSDSGIAVSDLAGGMYFAVLHSGSASEQLKFIKK